MFTLYLGFIQFNSGTSTCWLTRPSSLSALTALLAELLFMRGGDCTSLDDLPELYQQHFGVPLLVQHFEVSDIQNLIDLPEIKAVVKLVDVQVSKKSKHGLLLVFHIVMGLGFSKTISVKIVSSNVTGVCVCVCVCRFKKTLFKLSQFSLHPACWLSS